jgi:hypothetical protein
MVNIEKPWQAPETREAPAPPESLMRWRLLAVVAAVVAAVVPFPPALVERYYSTGLYPWIQSTLTGVSNLTDVALLDALIAAALAIWVLLFLRDALARRGRTARHPLARLVLRTSTAAACFYLLFLATWGLNYRRLPLAQKLEIDQASISPQGAAALAAHAVVEMNRLYPIAAAARGLASADPQASLALALQKTQRLLSSTAPVRPGRPKHTWLDWYFRRAAIDGMTDPYFLETLVQKDLLPVERPIVIAHEWAHLAGYADEGEANFVGWLACVSASPDASYSAWLFLYSQTARGLPPSERSSIAGAIAAGPRSDLLAIALRVQTQVSPRLSAAGWSVYDRYLKANRVERGTQSYADVVRLVLGTGLGARLTPAAGS